MVRFSLTMLHHENGTQVVPFLFSWWNIKQKNSKNFKKTIDKRDLRCYNLTNLILKSYDEEGFYQAFSQRVGEGEIPIKTDRDLITSELGAPKRILE